MASFFKNSAILLALTLVPALAQVRQKVTLYSNTGSRGEYLALDAVYDANLGSKNWNNRARSVCVTGTWLFYDYSNFNTGVDAPMEYVFGSIGGYCTDLAGMSGKVTSVRFAGYRNDYRSDTLTLYRNIYFQGEEEYLTLDARNLRLDGASKSLIITGRSSWTIYDQPNFGGASICVNPPKDEKYSPALVYDTAKVINAPHNAIRSVRKGCTGQNMISVLALAPSGNFTVDPVV